MRKKVSWVLDADIRDFFGTISHEWMVKFLQHRIADRRILRLIQKWLRAGVSEDGEWSKTIVGTPQGAVISPLLANVHLHYVFDLCVQHWRQHRTTGEVVVVRYADDGILEFQYRADAERFLQEWRERLRKFGLELHPDKTRLIELGTSQLRVGNSVEQASRRRSTPWDSHISVDSSGRTVSSWFYARRSENASLQSSKS